MKQQNKVLLAALLALSCLAPTFLAVGYWNDLNQADCEVCHNPGARFFYAPSLGITVDGRRAEGAWNYRRGTRLIVPVAYENGTFHQYVEMAFARDNQYVYVTAKWRDDDVDMQDAFYICWNVNAENFTAAYYDGMEVAAGAGWVDSWTVIKGANLNGSEFRAGDDAFNASGWNQGDLENQDVKAALIHHDGIYQCEIKRRVTTWEPSFDVQFNQNRSYEFNIGVCDRLAHQNHYISTNQRVQFDTAPVAENTASGLPDQTWDIFHAGAAPDASAGADQPGSQADPAATTWMVVAIVALGAFGVVVPLLLVKLKNKGVAGRGGPAASQDNDSAGSA